VSHSKKFYNKKRIYDAKASRLSGRQLRANMYTSSAQQSSCSERLLRKRIILSRLFQNKSYAPLENGLTK